jgi:hypothetical protein
VTWERAGNPLAGEASVVEAAAEPTLRGLPKAGAAPVKAAAGGDNPLLDVRWGGCNDTIDTQPAGGAGTNT